jgi:prolyl-tRNA synthetase
MTTGANEDDHHLRGVSIERDIGHGLTDIRGVSEGDACPLCDGVLKVAKAIEVGHIFKLGTKYSDSMGARVLTAEGKEVPIVMGATVLVLNDPRSGDRAASRRGRHHISNDHCAIRSVDFL